MQHLPDELRSRIRDKLNATERQHLAVVNHAMWDEYNERVKVKCLKRKPMDFWQAHWKANHGTTSIHWALLCTDVFPYNKFSPWPSPFKIQVQDNRVLDIEQLMINDYSKDIHIVVHDIAAAEIQAYRHQLRKFAHEMQNNSGHVKTLRITAPASWLRALQYVMTLYKPLRTVEYLFINNTSQERILFPITDTTLILKSYTATNIIIDAGDAVPSTLVRIGCINCKVDHPERLQNQGFKCDYTDGNGGWGWSLMHHYD